MAATQGQGTLCLQMVPHKIGTTSFQSAMAARPTNGQWYYRLNDMLDVLRPFGQLVLLDYDKDVAQSGTILPALAAACGQSGLPDGEDRGLNACVTRKEA